MVIGCPLNIDYITGVGCGVELALVAKVSPYTHRYDSQKEGATCCIGHNSLITTYPLGK